MNHYVIPFVRHWLSVICLGGVATFATGALHADDGRPVDVDFTRDIRPLLSNTCFKCHGPDEDARQADLRLDTFEGATADLGGYSAISPGSPDHSAALERITTSDPDLLMPPPDSGLKLSEQQIELLRNWIKAGGEYQQHWAFREIRRPDVPALPQDADDRLATNSIDAFVLRKLRAAGIEPSEPADRHTQIRRAYLDLLGLPPSPEQVERFLNDTAPGAYERMLETALANPHFGEKWGRHWLDQARYADTNGYTIDSPRSIWPYRDWVIQALNDDLPFDEFTVRQLAGDLLPAADEDQLIATGFHRNTLVNQEGGTDREQFRNEAVIDRVNTTGAVWLGLTVGCAQCHTHKYDPLTQREYYQLFAFFNSSQDVNSVTPTTTVPTPKQHDRLTALDRQIASANAAIKAYQAARDGAGSTNEPPVAWQLVTPASISSTADTTFETLPDGSILVSGPTADEDVYTLTFPAATSRITALKLEALTHSSLPKNGPGRAGNGNFVLNDVTLATSTGSAAWQHATADHSQANYHVSAAVDGDPATGWAINVSSGNMNVDRTAHFLCTPLETPVGQNITIRLTFGANPPKYNLGRFRVSVTESPHAKIDVAADAELARLEAELQTAKDAKTAFAKTIPTTMVMRELPKPRDTHVLIRGDFLRQGDPVRPSGPEFLTPMPDDAQTRLDLARWLVDGRNPLTARVTVNRIWMRLFGHGLVETENDFGLQGTPPTHPELLDWLADDFMRNDWSIKHLIRTIMTSATYRRSSALRADLADADPLNKLLARQSRIRVDAEIVRDLALSVSGLLDGTIGGESVYPPQPDGVYAFTQRAASWPTSTGGDRYRRGMYTFFMRSAPHPMLTTFDTPAFNTSCTRRVRSNTPLQSLTMANDEALVETAQALGRRLANANETLSTGSLVQQIQFAFRLCLARSAAPGEVDALASFYEAQLAGFRENPDEAARLLGTKSNDDANLAELAAWTATARVLLNLDEFITRE